MKYKIPCVPVLMFFLLTSFPGAQVNDFPILQGPYLGQEPPGKTPEIFAPGVISTDSAHEFAITFAPDGTEIFFTRRISGAVGNRIYYMRFQEGIWKGPNLLPFSDGSAEMEPNFTPDGETITFNSRRPLPASIETGNPSNVWIARKENGTWKTCEVFGPPISDLFPMYVTQTWDSTIYFTGNVNRGIYRAEYESGEYRTPERLPDEINSRYWAGHPFIDPDEKYILFDSNIDTLGTKNLFISFRMASNKWSPSVNVNEHLGYPNHAAMPHVTIDGRYLFFSSLGDIYWVTTSFLECLKERHQYAE